MFADVCSQFSPDGYKVCLVSSPVGRESLQQLCLPFLNQPVFYGEKSGGPAFRVGLVLCISTVG